ncbi:MAG TPA: formate/nitrite transporter family protein [Gemmatimonadales bacterium]|nr:formate/nitrite transporter family protein [Gemmatimonadales bacterium]
MSDPEPKAPPRPPTRSARRPEASTRLSAVQIHDNVLAGAEKELERSSFSLFFSSLASGLAIGFSFLVGGYLMTLVPDGWGMAAAAAAYPIGFIFVIMGRSELFTENTLTPVLAVLDRRDLQSFLGMLRLWGILLVGNLLGTFIYAWVVARTTALAPELHPELLKLAGHATAGGFGDILYKAVFAGWLIALLTWLLAATVDTFAQLTLIWICTAAISALGFRHAVVGSVEAFYRAFRAGDYGWGHAFGDFVVPAVIGNAIGGVLLVALLNYAQVRPERPPSAQSDGE